MEPSTLLARTQVAALDGIRPLIELLASEDAKVLTGAGSALFNLCLDSSFAAAVRQLGALPKLQALMDHADLSVVASVTSASSMQRCPASLSVSASPLRTANSTHAASSATVAP